MTLEELGLGTPGVPQAEYVRERLHYGPTTGIFTWLARPIRYQTDLSWNSRYAGKRAGSEHLEGYWLITIDSTRYRAARLAFLYMTGKWPSYEIDHIDRNRGNDQWSNLRELNHQQQSFNTGLSSRNKSGIKGVSFLRKRGKWQADIRVNYKMIYLGIFNTLEEAAVARKAAEAKYHSI